MYAFLPKRPNVRAKNVVHSGDLGLQLIGQDCPECFILHNPERTQLTLTVPVDALKKIIKCYL